METKSFRVVFSHDAGVYNSVCEWVVMFWTLKREEQREKRT